jgi:DNA-binding Lrp family transcriptional regulator
VSELRDATSSSLAAVGVDALGVRVYRELLRAGPTAAPALAAALSTAPGEVTSRLTELDRLGLVRVRGERASARPPRIALEGLVDQQARMLAERETALNALRISIPAFVAEEGARSAEALRGDLEVRSDDEIVPLLQELTRGTTGEIRLMHSPDWLDADVATTWADLTFESEETSGRKVRGIYPSAVLGHGEAVRLLHQWAGQGEHVRLHPAPPSRLAVFGGSAALVPAEWGRVPRHRIVVRSPGLVAAMATLFDLVWARSTPLEPLPSDERDAVLRLLTSGLKDEAIARQLGISLRTVRRRVAELLDELGPRTRFAAGVEAVRQRRV